jgi:hypothetical protein
MTMSTLWSNPADIEKGPPLGRLRMPSLAISRQAGLGLLISLTFLIFLVASSLPRIAQPLSYHRFADQRPLFGIPNFGDVASNLPFAVIGISGLVFLLRARLQPARHFLDSRETWPYVCFFNGLLLTAFGSSWYHLAPDNQRLVWDRLPMTITFMSLVAAIIAERINLRLGLWLLPVLLSAGITSVVQWKISEARGQGDLRFYVALQAYSAAVLLLAFVLPRIYTRSSELWLVLGFYVLAKILEVLDLQVLSALHLVSGHSLKHLTAAASSYCVLRMLRNRQPLAVIDSPTCALMVRDDHD